MFSTKQSNHCSCCYNQNPNQKITVNCENHGGGCAGGGGTYNSCGCLFLDPRTECPSGTNGLYSYTGATGLPGSTPNLNAIESRIINLEIDRNGGDDLSEIIP